MANFPGHEGGTTLWLFDIDGTLVDTGGAGMAALQEATVQLPQAPDA